MACLVQADSLNRGLFPGEADGWGSQGCLSPKVLGGALFLKPLELQEACLGSPGFLHTRGGRRGCFDWKVTLLTLAYKSEGGGDRHLRPCSPGNLYKGFATQ